MESRKRPRYEMTCFLSLSLLATIGATPHLQLPRSIDGWIAQEAQINYQEHVQELKSDALARVVGGTEVAPGTYPFFVRIRGNIGASDCGGSLVAPDVVLTAGHCDTVGGEVFTVVVNGSTRAFDAAAGQINRSVSRVIRHPDFNIDTFANDFMLLQIDEPVDIKPVILNTDLGIPALSDKVGVIGLGALSENGFNYPDTLREVWVDTIDVSECFNDYASEGLSIVRNDIMFCASTPGKDACQGDSGGPVLSEEKVQVGIVSFGLGCARPGFPGVYAKVSSRTDWLNENICELSAFCVNGKITTSQADGETLSTTPTAATSAPAATVETTTTAPAATVETTTSSPVVGSTSAPIGTTSVPVAVTLAPVTPVPVSNSVTNSPTFNPTQMPSMGNMNETEPTSSASDAPGSSPPSVIGAVTDIPTYIPTQQPSTGSTSVSEPTSFAAEIPGASSAPVAVVNYNGARGPGICDDFLDKTFAINTGYLDRKTRGAGRGDRDCLWLQTQTPEMIAKYCDPEGGAYEICEETCGKCVDSCKDVENAAFLVNITQGAEPELHGCAWLQERPNMRAMVCTPDNDAYSVCPETCNSCSAEADSVPNRSASDMLLATLETRGRNRSGDPDKTMQKILRFNDDFTRHRGSTKLLAPDTEGRKLHDPSA